MCTHVFDHGILFGSLCINFYCGYLIQSLSFRFVCTMGIICSGALLYRDTYMPVLFVKVSEPASTSIIAIKVSERHLLAFFRLLQYRYIRYGILFQV